MSEVQVSLVPTEHTQTVWPAVAGFIEAALAYTRGCYELEDIYHQLISGTHNLWVAFEGEQVLGAVITNIMQYPRKRALVCYMAGGDNLTSWKEPMMVLLTKFASDNGCDCMEATGRPGWLRMFKNEGCEAVWQTCQLPIVRS